GTQVELLREFGSEPTTMTTPALPFHALSSSSHHDRAAVALQGQTNSRGELELRGSPVGTYVLRILGPGHQPVLQPEMTLVADAPPHVVTVSAGATVIGKIGPPEMLEQLMPATAAGAFAAAGDDVAKRRAVYERFRPGLLFVRTDAGKQSTHPVNGFFGRLPLEEDGSFEVKGIPTGTWDLRIAYWLGNRGAENFVQTLADLGEGEVRRIEADLSHLLPGRVTGVVKWNGVPFESGS